MARHDVYRGAGAYLLDCQSDYLSGLDTRFVVPLLPEGEVPRVFRLNPIFSVEGERVVMATQLGSSVPARHLRDRVASLADQHDVIVNAFDALLTGY
ncbi:MAG TPA: CcdB family protein [Allosphingosinicella sp.]|jgi:toxin CcdB|nr:CcdB family protein [Allosphingosinicella sp.]